MRSRLKTEFDGFCRQTAGKVRAYMFCACRSRADAEDLVQECYLRALRGWGMYNGRGSREAWLFGIARRTCADWYRKKSRKSAAAGLASLDDIEADSGGRANADRIEAVWGAIGELGAEQGEVVRLRFAADLSYAEMAAVLGVPVGTVRSRLHRGLKTIREKLKEQEDGT
jgi:RNA polymerase sigma-70 factor (ECF subfamily)